VCTTSTSVMFVAAARSASTLTARQTLRRVTAGPRRESPSTHADPLNVSTLTASADHDAPLERIPRPRPLVHRPAVPHAHLPLSRSTLAR
jgi:hypothetical protein